MKSALTCHGTAWTSALAPVLLGIRSALKEDIGFSAAQLVYGESIHLPGEFFVAPANLAPRDMLARIQSHLSEFSPTPAPDHSKPSFFIHPALQSASHVMLRIDAPTPPLSPHYTGPHRVLERTDKTFTLDLNGKPKTVTIDRLKPAFVESPEPPQPRPDHVDLPLFQLHQLYPSTTTCRTPTSTCCAPTTPRYTSTATGAATAERPKPVRVTPAEIKEEVSSAQFTVKPIRTYNSMSQTPPTNSDGDKTPPCGVPRTTETSDEYTVLSHLPTLCVILTTCVRPVSDDLSQSSATPRKPFISNLRSKIGTHTVPKALVKS
ncbi:Hypothetical predicted protein [Cloeon dipterum]|uniref:Uncharacterized protein n=1 Tax=Cloeon dipterum TaxID=197152 RepID=A0A8S1DEQ3_9INSE|nr:Hypothetical predicted protein [Cloeon dipterum]